MRTVPLKWKQDGYLWFAHEHYGMWTIELRRRRYILTLNLRLPKGVPWEAGYQDVGSYPTLKKAQAEAGRSHRVLLRQELSSQSRRSRR